MAFLASSVKHCSVGIYAVHAMHIVETIAEYLAMDPSCGTHLITCADTSQYAAGAEHPWTLSRISERGRVALVDWDSEPFDLDFLLIVADTRHVMRTQRLRRWRNVARSHGLLTHQDYRSGLYPILSEIYNLLPYCLFPQIMIFQASSGAWQPYLQARHKLFYTPTAHPQWIFSNDQRAALFADWRPNQERRYILSFVGSQTPVERGVLLRELSDYIESKGLAFDNDYPPGSHEPRTSEPRRVLWVTYGPTDARRGLNGVHYVEATRESEFVLCPLGWGGNWTHRVPESLICGAIPITPYPDRYNLGLRDGLNCLEVRRSNWREAVERALRMQLGERQRLRENILKVRAELEPENAARKVRQKLNVGA